MRKAIRGTGPTLCLVLTIALAAHAAPTITVDFQNEIGTLEPELLGINHPMTELCYQAGFDTTSGRFAPELYEAVGPLGLQHWRYTGGTGSGSFFWWRSIGAYPREPGFYKPGSYCRGGGTADHYHDFGFVEFMEFMDDIDADGTTVNLNFGTEPAAARRAADWVEFANAEVGVDPNGDGVDWAAVRASLGHPEPYGIRYWEVGNELGGVYVIGGSSGHYRNSWAWHYGLLPDPLDGEDSRQRIDNYLLGGSQPQYRDACGRGCHPYQLVTRENNWSIDASRSYGLPDETFFIRYPPANPDTAFMALYVSADIGDPGHKWRRVDDLTAWGAQDSVYVFDPATGRIDFGDGTTHGAIPAESSLIGVQYVSIGKDGMVDFYRQIKSVDPEARVSSSFFTDEFLLATQEAALDTLPFDCVSIHPYLEVESNEVLAEHWRLQDITSDMAQDLLTRSTRLDSLFGPGDPVDLLVSEFNVIVLPSIGDSTCPNPTYGERKLRYFGKSLGQTLALANGVMEMLRLSEEARIRTLGIHMLIPFAAEVDMPPCGWDMTAFVGIGGGGTYLNASGLFYSILTTRSGDTLLGPLLTDCPILDHEFSAEVDITLPYLTALAMKDPSGESAALFVINRASALPDTVEEHSDIAAVVSFLNAPDFKYMQVYELNADSLWHYNSADNPHAVSLTRHPDLEFAADFEYTFPAHSITVLVPTGITTGVIDVVSRPKLHQNAPNPFNPVTTIRFELPVPMHVGLAVYNLAGRRVRTLLDGPTDAGEYAVGWDGRNERGEGVASGVYFYRLEVNGESHTRKGILIR